MNIKRSIAQIVLMCLAYSGIAVFASSEAYSQSSSISFVISTFLRRRCRIRAIDFDFGEYDPVDANQAADLDGLGEVRVRCIRGTRAHIGFNVGINALGTTRRMAGQAGVTDFLSYELYSDSGRTVIWGNAAPMWVPYTASNRRVTRIPIYGRIPMAQDVGVGDYEDTVTATINF